MSGGWDYVGLGCMLLSISAAASMLIGAVASERRARRQENTALAELARLQDEWNEWKDKHPER